MTPDNSTYAQADKLIDADLQAGKIDLEYLPVQGYQPFLDVTSQVILGKDSKALKEGRVAVVQSLSGTGALRIAGEFLKVSPTLKPLQLESLHLSWDVAWTSLIAVLSNSTAH